jgi:hypothetical protein
MAKTKYGKHLTKAPFQLDRGGKGLHVLYFVADKYGIKATWVLLPVTTPSTGESLPTHSHDFFQFISWFGANPENIGEFEAEEYICLGAEQEKHIVNTPTVQILPPGTPHCPGGWLKVDKPIYHMDVFFSNDYVKKDTPIPDVPGRREPGTRYSKNFVPANIAPAVFGPPVPTFHFSTAEYGVDAGWIVVPVLEPRMFQKEPHKHDFHQFFCFLGSDPEDIRKFDAEIEVYLGEEGEKHVITTPTVLHVPPGLMHCPMEYKRVGKPVIHLDVFFAPRYERIPASR